MGTLNRDFKTIGLNPLESFIQTPDLLIQPRVERSLYFPEGGDHTKVRSRGGGGPVMYHNGQSL